VQAGYIANWYQLGFVFSCNVQQVRRSSTLRFSLSACCGGEEEVDTCAERDSVASACEQPF